jgi:hypothetical protein
MTGSLAASYSMVSSRLLRYVFGDDASLTNHVTSPADHIVLCGKPGNFLRTAASAAMPSAVSMYARNLLSRSRSAASHSSNVVSSPPVQQRRLDMVADRSTLEWRERKVRSCVPLRYGSLRRSDGIGNVPLGCASATVSCVAPCVRPTYQKVRASISHPSQASHAHGPTRRGAMFVALASCPLELQPLSAKAGVRGGCAGSCDDDSDLQVRLKEYIMTGWPCSKEFVVVVVAVVGGAGR